MKRILVIEDDPETTAFCRVYLKRRSHEILTEGDPRRALDLLDTHSVDLIILDYQLPVLSGAEVLKKLAARSGPRIPAMIISKTTTPAIVANCLKLGAVDYVVKPLEPQMFVERVERALARHSNRRIRSFAFDEEFARAEVEASSQFESEVKVRSRAFITAVSELGLTLRVKEPIDPQMRIRVRSPLFEEMGISPPVLHLKPVSCHPSRDGLEYELSASTISISHENTMERIRNWMKRYL